YERHVAGDSAGGTSQPEGGCYPATSVNRFVRSALFPLVIIVLLVYLASQTLINHDSNTKKVTFSDLINDAKGGLVQQATFNPNRQEIKATLTDQTKVKVHYPSDQSQFAFQQALQTGSPRATFDSKGIGSSPWWTLLTSLLPIVLLLAFWLFLMNQVQGG